ncbi:MAG: hypothetical protein WC564_00425 [Patescibacteria group bacterium]|jgi:hypothetical protein
MPKPWFKKTGWIHRPITWAGYFSLLFFLLFAVNIVVIVGLRSNSIPDTFLGSLPYLISVFLLYEWVAWRQSLNRK